MHEGAGDFADVVEALGPVSHVETHTLTTFGHQQTISIFKTNAATANEQAGQALWFVTNVFPTKGAARDYIREKERYS
jgi:hypothetical protein